MATFTPPVQEHAEPQGEGAAPYPRVRSRTTSEDEDEEISLEEADRQLKRTIAFLNSVLGNSFE